MSSSLFLDEIFVTLELHCKMPLGPELRGLLQMSVLSASSLGIFSQVFLAAASCGVPGGDCGMTTVAADIFRARFLVKGLLMDGTERSCRSGE